ncbi:MAG: Spx/MgsR family RNA polymerase-binding regulatory protein [Wenzhouxiangellaceae bacterium]|nr:Spx/MgsR family RNA polymerase-binding regulatory protein [Wenzhouxiangellaceae bacterium]
MGLAVFGIKACDRCRKARKWLDQHGVVHAWVDLREDGIDERQVRDWLARAGAERLVNRRSTTWRQLDPAQRPALDSPDWPRLLVDYPTLIKRPVFVDGTQIQVGFDDALRSWLSAR